MRVIWCSLATLAFSCSMAGSKTPGSTRESDALSRSAPPPAAQLGACRRPAPEGGIQGTLDAVASCFHEAVLLLHREPAKGESLAEFLGAASSPGAAILVLPDGAAIAFAVTDQQHDLYDDGHSDFVTTYRFSAPGHMEFAETTLVLTVGGPMESSGSQE